MPPGYSSSWRGERPSLASRTSLCAGRFGRRVVPPFSASEGKVRTEFHERKSLGMNIDDGPHLRGMLVDVLQAN